MKKRIIVFGLGRIFGTLRERIIQRFDVVACTDRCERPQGDFWLQRFIKPHDIPTHFFDMILICSTRYYGEIKKYLIDLGVQADKIYSIRCLISEKEEAKKIVEAWRKQGILTPDDKLYKNQIFVIGDSHTCFFGGDEVKDAYPLGDLIGINGCRDVIKPFKVFHIGPGLAYNALKYETFAATREKVEFLLKFGFIPKKSLVLCSFGEIDIRVHAIKQAEQQRIPVKKVLDDIIEHYLNFLLFLKNTNQVMVWGPIPSTKEGSHKDPLWPYYGSEQERNKATEYFNRKLQFICNNNGIMYISIFKYLIDQDYMTKDEYLSDGYHLSQKAWKYATSAFEEYGINVTLL